MQKPPFTITPKILNLSTKITQMLTKYEGLKISGLDLKLGKINRIKSIQSSLAIEGNKLSEGLVEDIINNKRVIGPKRDILEVKNAIKAYEEILHYDYKDEKSLLKAHKLMMQDLLPDAGTYRQKGIAVREGENIIVHLAPPAARVPELMSNVFTFLKEEREVHPLILSSVFHYELEFIHPFSDGNGRTGRLWQTVILYAYNSLFEYVPVETIIKKNQMRYYDVLAQSGKDGHSTVFIEFLLDSIHEALEEFSGAIRPTKQSVALRLELGRKKFGKKFFKRKDYLALHPHISTATASNDLLYGCKHNLLVKKGDKALAVYSFRL